MTPFSFLYFVVGKEYARRITMAEQYNEKLSDMSLAELLMEKQEIIQRMTKLDEDLRNFSDEYIMRTRPLKRQKTLLQQAIQKVKSEIKSKSGAEVSDPEPLDEKDWEGLL